jgi:hypothetical protein
MAAHYRAILLTALNGRGVMQKIRHDFERFSGVITQALTAPEYVNYLYHGQRLYGSSHPGPELLGLITSHRPPENLTKALTIIKKVGASDQPAAEDALLSAEKMRSSFQPQQSNKRLCSAELIEMDGTAEIPHNEVQQNVV